MRPVVIASAHDLIARNCLQWGLQTQAGVTTVAIDFQNHCEIFDVTITTSVAETTYQRPRLMECLTCATMELITELLSELGGKQTVVVLIPGGIELTIATVRLQEAIETAGSGLNGYRLAHALTAVDSEVVTQLLLGASDEFDIATWMNTCRLATSVQWADDSDASVSEVLLNDLRYADQVIITGNDTQGREIISQVAPHVRIEPWQELEQMCWNSCSHDVDRALARVNDEE